MPTLPQRKRDQRHMHLLHAARRCFEAQGYHPTTMEDIIRASGFSAGAVYRYFKSKDDLILAAAEASMAELAEAFAPLLRREPIPAPKDFVRLLTHAIDTVSRRGDVDLRRMALLGWAEAQRNEQIRAKLRAHHDRLLLDLARVAEQWEESGAAARPDRAAVARTLLALVLGLVVQGALVETGHVDAFDETVHLFL